MVLFIRVFRGALQPSGALALFGAALGLSVVSNVATAAPVDTDRWTVLAIGMVLVASEDEPVDPPPELDPASLDPTQILQGDPAQITDCETYLQAFLADTEYLGPLLDFADCASGGALDYALDSLVGAQGVVDSIRAFADELRPYVLGLPKNLPNTVLRSLYICTIGSAANKPSAVMLTATGDTRCTSINAMPNPDAGVMLDGSVQVVDFLRGVGYLNTATVVGDGVVAVRGTMKNLTPLRVFKTKYHTNLVLPGEQCLGGDCQYTWAVLPNKNPNTGTTLPCQLPGGQPFSARLECEVDSRPYTQGTLD